MDHKLPETASLLAIYLRDVTGDQRLFARVIGPNDPANIDPDGIDYILVGNLFNGEETEVFTVTPPNCGSSDWRLGQIAFYPGNFREPPSSDFADILVSRSLADVLGKMALVLFQERLATAQLCLEHDRHDLYNGVPL